MTSACRIIARCFIGALSLTIPMETVVGSSQADSTKPRGGFVTANSIRLHYIDWGGTGDVLLLLTGLGDTIDTFDSFAPRFTDHFRVVGVERRGQGQSEKPSSGYETRTLADDIRAFLDAMRLNRVSLIGHSIAGAEMTMFAGVFPERVVKLVYLDAAYDYARAHDLAEAAHFPFPQETDAAIASIEKGANRVHPDYGNVKAPALAFFVLYDKPYVTPGMSEDERRLSEAAFKILEGAYKKEQIELFRTRLKRGRVIELHDTNHMFFKDPRRQDEVVQQMRAFLLSQ